MILDNIQRQIVDHVDGPLLCAAVPGAGKSTCVVMRVKRLVDDGHADPKSILATTFTKRAARELNERLAVIGVKTCRVGTSHSVCYEWLREYGKEFGGEYRIRGNYPITVALADTIGLTDDATPAELVRFMGWCKNWLISPKTAATFPTEVMEYFRLESISQKDLRQAYVEGYAKLEAHRRASKFLTFDDILCQCYLMFRRKPEVLEILRERFKYIMVDETQDNNLAQHTIFKAVAAPRNNLMVVGDDSQSIYGFRAANPRFMLGFEAEFSSKVLHMERNYRSRPDIVTVSNNLIVNNKERLDTTIRATRSAGGKVTCQIYRDGKAEADAIAYAIKSRLLRDKVPAGNFAVLCRTKMIIDNMQQSMARYRVPFKVVGGKSLFDYACIKDVMGYLEYAHSLHVNVEDREAFVSVINKPSRHLGPAFVTQVIHTASSQPDATLLQVARQVAGKAVMDDVIKFENIIKGIGEQIVGKTPPKETLQWVLKEIDYVRRIGKDQAYTKFLEQKFQNLCNIASSHKTIEKLLKFIEQLELLGDDDASEDDVEGTDKALLMTIHVSKGCQFPVVFVPSLVEGVLPHGRAIQLGNLEEERRLCYVAFSRAQEELHVSRSMMAGPPSRFLTESGLGT